MAGPSQDDPPAPLSGCATATMERPSEILLQIVHLKFIGNNGTTVATYGLIDSGSDVTMIGPSLVESCLRWSILGGSVNRSKKHHFNLNHVSCEEISFSH